jgi:hypothetical protein
LDYKPTPKLTKEFIEKKIKVNWRDLAWALSNHWLDVGVIADLAEGIAVKDENLRSSLAIAGINGDAKTLKVLINQQLQNYTAPDETVRERWMLLAVAWLYQNRHAFDDPWLALEELWEAFDHPAALNGLIRWMPAAPGMKIGEEAMLKRWHVLATSFNKGCHLR